VTPPLPLDNDDELVTAAWIATIPGFTAEMTGAQLPPDTDEHGKPAAWLRTGFVTVASVGGTPDDMLPVNRPVMEVKCWAAVPGSDDPPWLMARALASAIQRAVWQRKGVNRLLTINVNGLAYPPAVVQGAYMAQTFRRIYADPGDYACYQADMGLTWITVGDRIP
jgi:hypothetical protein